VHLRLLGGLTALVTAAACVGPVAGDMRRLAARYREEGTPVTFRLLDGAEHTQAGIAFMPLAMAFLTEHLVPSAPAS
jgi:hypothetical protein